MQDVSNAIDACIDTIAEATRGFFSTTLHFLQQLLNNERRTFVSTSIRFCFKYIQALFDFTSKIVEGLMIMILDCILIMNELVYKSENGATNVIISSVEVIRENINFLVLVLACAYMFRNRSFYAKAIAFFMLLVFLIFTITIQEDTDTIVESI